MPQDRAAARTQERGMVTPHPVMDPPAGRSSSAQAEMQSDPSAGEDPLERALSEAEVRAEAQAKLGEAGPLEDFVLAAVHDRAVRLARGARLCADALPITWPLLAVVNEGNV